MRKEVRVMAIFHFQVQIITRGKGQSAVASASYRSGEKLVDERTGETKFYKRAVQPETMILAPSHAPEWVYDRNRLWNEVEKVEKNWNSQLSREINVALPRELSNEKQVELIRNFVQDQFVDKGMVADIAIHRDDQNNPHAHIMLTVRQFNEHGEWGNKKKKEYQLDRNGEKVLDKNGKPKYKTVSLTDWDNRDNVTMWREQWANYANQTLEKEGISEKITHLSHEARGLEELPTVHLGHVNHAMEKRGIQTEKGDHNRFVQEHNAIVVQIQELQAKKEALELQDQKEQHAQLFLTDDERVAIKEAEKGMGEEATLSSISDFKRLVNDWKEDVERNHQRFLAKGLELQQAKKDLTAVQKIETDIKQQEKILNNAGLFEFKVKNEAKKKLESLHTDLEYRNAMLKPVLEKLDMRSKQELSLEINKYESRETKHHDSYRTEMATIRKQKAQLDKAENAIKRGEVRRITAPYPELRTTREFLSYETALKMEQLNNKKGEPIPLDMFNKFVELKHEQGKESSYLDLFEGVVQGIADAQKQEQQATKKNAQKQRYRGQKVQVHEHEM